MTAQPCWIDLRGRAVLRLNGPDRVRYLNGQVSNDVNRVTPESAIEACVCNLKGKLDGVVFITASDDGDSLLIDAPGELRESLFARLSRYIIADDCELEDVTEDFTLAHVLGELPNVTGRSANRFGPDGIDFWQNQHPPEALADCPQMPDDEVEELRILHGIPKWGAELSPEVFPAEAGLDKRAVDFQKGCYLGQEVISRIQSVGHVNRELRLLVSEDSEAKPEAGWEFFSGKGEKAAGTLTSVIFSEERGRYIGLGMVKRPFADPDSRLVTGPPGDKLAIGLEVQKFKD